MNICGNLWFIIILARTCTCISALARSKHEGRKQACQPVRQSGRGLLLLWEIGRSGFCLLHVKTIPGQLRLLNLKSTLSWTAAFPII